MLKQVLKFKTALIFSIGLSLLVPCAFAQGHNDSHNGGNRSSAAHARGNARGNGRGSRHYYHNGNWNRNGWFGWGVQAPIYTDGVLVASLPPGYTTVLVGGNTYYYGNDTYFRQMSAGGFAVVTVPIAN